MSLSVEAIAKRYGTALQAVRDIARAYYYRGSLKDALHLWQAGEQFLAGTEVPHADEVAFLLDYASFLTDYYFLTHQEEDRMRAVLQRVQQCAEATEEEPARARALFLWGKALYNHQLLEGESDYASARANFQQASSLQERIGDTYQLAESLFYTGLTYDRMEQSEQAKHYYLHALPIASQAGNTWGASEVHRHLTDHTKGEERLRHALRSLELREEMGFTRSLPPAQLLISEIYVDQAKENGGRSSAGPLSGTEEVLPTTDHLRSLAIALEYCRKAEALAQEMDLQIYVCQALLIRGDIAFEQGNAAEARAYFAQALLLAEQLKDAYGIASAKAKLEQLAQKE